ncbi:hypothetical protein CFOL_v3_34548 [Cephalotus follicularis]|uniref:Uncharacterized protein n=1 Tax=Cephalotus follicularis TaxID=3775 RepID=A0A1Q3DFE3_CEPFO|nr:hypothetical protein CFOL_v3_34548 [Cephalotus follicularis]
MKLCITFFLDFPIIIYHVMRERNFELSFFIKLSNPSCFELSIFWLAINGYPETCTIKRTKPSFSFSKPSQAMHQLIFWVVIYATDHSLCLMNETDICLYMC